MGTKVGRTVSAAFWRAGDQRFERQRWWLAKIPKWERQPLYMTQNWETLLVCKNRDLPFNCTKLNKWRKNQRKHSFDYWSKDNNCRSRQRLAPQDTPPPLSPANGMLKIPFIFCYRASLTVFWKPRHALSVIFHHINKSCWLFRHTKIACCHEIRVLSEVERRTILSSWLMSRQISLCTIQPTRQGVEWEWRGEGEG
jgi:hypothetical protein